MAEKKPKKQDKGLFDAIRKPTAPASQKFGPMKRKDKLDPVGRKTKHKNKVPKVDPDADL